MEDTGTDTESSRASHDITVGGVGTDATAALEAAAASASVFDFTKIGVSAEASGLALDTPTVIVAESRSTEPGGGAPPLCAEIIRSSVYISPLLL